MKEKLKNTHKPIDTNYELNLSTTYSVAECIEHLQSLANPRDMSFKVIIKKKRKDIHRFTLVHINKYGTRTIVHGRFTAQINGNTHVMSKVGMPYPPALDVILLGISLLLMIFAGLSDVLWAKFFFFGVFMPFPNSNCFICFFQKEYFSKLFIGKIWS